MLGNHLLLGPAQRELGCHLEQKSTSTIASQVVRACLVAASQAAPTQASDPRRWISIAWGCDRLPGTQAQTRAATKHAQEPTISPDKTAEQPPGNTLWHKRTLQHRLRCPPLL